MAATHPDETPDVRKIVETEIVAVTVYTDQALVTRRGSITLTGQEQKLIIAHLPPCLETESVRVSGTSTMGVSLLGVSCERFFTTEPVAARVTHLVQQIQQLEAEWQQLQVQIDALALQSRFIEGLRDKTQEPFAQSLSRKNLSLSETLDFLNFLGSQYSEYAIATAECKAQQREVDKQLVVLRQQLQHLQTPNSKQGYSVVVAIEPTGSGEFYLEVSYVVHRAHWTPLYDLRLNSQKNVVHLAYLAEITQHTTEDWTGVELTLSTAKPGLGSLPPKLEPWYIDIPKPIGQWTRRRTAIAAPLPVSSSATDNFTENYEQETEIPAENLSAVETAVAELSQQGSVVNFQLSSHGNIPSDGTPHKVTILEEGLPCDFKYVSVPRLVSFAYLQANMKNHALGATLLPGRANIFRDHVFVGTTQIENIVPGQEFQLNLGIDEGLKIERDLVERQVDKKLIGNIRKITYGYRISITNLLNKDVNLKITEQLPLSRNEQVKIRLTRSFPTIQVGELGLLEWVLTLSSQAQKEIHYQFTVEHPPEMTILGLDI